MGGMWYLEASRVERAPEWAGGKHQSPNMRPQNKITRDEGSSQAKGNLPRITSNISNI